MYVHGPVGNKAPAKRRTFGGGRVNCAVPDTAPGFLSMQRSNPQISSIQKSVPRPLSIQIHRVLRPCAPRHAKRVNPFPKIHHKRVQSKHKYTMANADSLASSLLQAPVPCREHFISRQELLLWCW